MSAVIESPVLFAPAQDLSLADLPVGASARVVSMANSGAASDVTRRLSELGFLPGEALRVVARGLLSREPIAVRIGTGTFALRRHEAEKISVRAEPFIR